MKESPDRHYRGLTLSIDGPHYKGFKALAREFWYGTVNNRIVTGPEASADAALRYAQRAIDDGSYISSLRAEFDSLKIGLQTLGPKANQAQERLTTLQAELEHAEHLATLALV